MLPFCEVWRTVVAGATSSVMLPVFSCSLVPLGAGLLASDGVEEDRPVNLDLKILIRARVAARNEVFAGHTHAFENGSCWHIGQIFACSNLVSAPDEVSLK